MADGEAGRPEPAHLLVGHVTKAHGTRGEVLVMPLTDEPDAYFAEGQRLLLGDVEGDVSADAEALTVERARPFKKGLLVKLEGFGDRSEVERLARSYLAVPAGEVRPLEEGEVFYHQLLGLVVETVEGESVGQVREVFETEPAHLLEGQGTEGKRHLIPFTERIVKAVDVDAGRVVIDPPPGLLEL